MSAPTRDPFELLADRLAGRQTSTMALATVVSATPTHATVDLLGAVVTAPRLAGPEPGPGDVVLVHRQGAMIVVAGAAAPGTGAGTAPGADAHHVHRQEVLAATWTVVHNLGKHPAVAVVDGAGTVLFAEVQHLDADSLTIRFGSPATGTAYCN